MTIIELYKILPRTNCAKCGQPACLAFAAKVIADGEDIRKCPDLSPEAEAMIAQITSQQQAQGKRPDSLAIALEFLQEKVAPLDFASLSEGLGAEYGEEAGRPYLQFSYFGHPLHIFKDQVRYPDGVAGNPWDAILLYNYIASQGNQPLAGRWITFQSLPNSVSKTKTLNKLEDKLAAHFSGQTGLLVQQVANARGELTDEAGNANLKAIFRPLPQVPVLLLFWDFIVTDNFPAQCHFLFDAHVMSYLDLESLLFLVEQLQERLMPA